LLSAFTCSVKGKHPLLCVLCGWNQANQSACASHNVSAALAHQGIALDGVWPFSQQASRLCVVEGR
jgi:hypothetical protein